MDNGNSKSIYDHIFTETNRVSDAFDILYKKAREAEDVEDNSTELDILKSTVIVMQSGVEEAINNIISAAHSLVGEEEQ